MTYVKYLAGALLALALAACSQTPFQPPADQLVTLAGLVGGAADAPTFRGKPLAVAGAAVTLNGNPASAAAVKPGVVIRGQAEDRGSSYRLKQVDVQRELEGPIEAISADLKSLTVLGQTFHLDASTLIEEDDGTPLTAADLKVGERVEVYGVQQADGVLLATRVERQTGEDDAEVEISGVVENLDLAAQTFTLSTSSTLTVDYRNATELPADLSNGLQVDVDGRLKGTTLIASEVKVDDGDEGNDGGDNGDENEDENEDEAGDIEGIVTALDAGARTLTVMGYAVSVDANTQYEVAGGAADAATFWTTVKLGDKLEVEGSVSADSILASQLELGSDNDEDDSGGQDAEASP